jgi:hypothetical protein
MNPTVVTIQEDEETQDIPTAPIKGKFLSQIKRARYKLAMMTFSISSQPSA